MDDLAAAFESQQPTYQRLMAALKPLLERTAADAGLTLFRIEGRVKTLESFKEKLVRPSKAAKYSKLSDVTDLCGVRVVLFDTDACSSFISLIKERFNVDEVNSMDKSLELEDDRFGYQSTHLVLELVSERESLFEFSDLMNLKAEVQVRTVLQHAWAALDHRLRYKSSIEAPRELRRKLFRISALLEAADEAFLEVSRSSESLQAGYQENVKQGTLSVELNRDTLEAFINQSDRLRGILNKSKAAGVEFHIDLEAGPTPWSYLLNSLKAMGLTTLQDLDQALAHVGDKEIGELKEIFVESRAFSYGIYGMLRSMLLVTLPYDKQVEVLQAAPSGALTGAAELKTLQRLHTAGSESA